MSERLDVYMFKIGLAKSRESAKTIIAEGKVYVNGKTALKPSLNVTSEDVIKIEGEVLKYVSRGGLKLEKAVKEFNIELKNKTAIDMGASTGGFTDYMLQNGAKKVYAVDVGSGQLHESLKSNPKVINMENINIRNLSDADINEKVNFISIDTSFISLTYILPVAFKYILPDGEIVALIKPQFEAGKENIGKNGIVKDKKVHLAVVNKIYNFIIEHGFTPVNFTTSPIKGGDGNVEFLVHIKKTGTPVDVCSLDF